MDAVRHLLANLCTNLLLCFSIEEDDGVLVTSAIRGAPEVNYTALIVLEAKNMKQIARSEFRLGGPVPKPLHGYFTGNNKFAR